MIILFIRLAPYISGLVGDSWVFPLPREVSGPVLECTCMITLDPHIHTHEYMELSPFCRHRNQGSGGLRRLLQAPQQVTGHVNNVRQSMSIGRQRHCSFCASQLFPKCIQKSNVFATLINYMVMRVKY